MDEWRARGGDGTCPRLLEVGRGWARFGEDLFWARRPGVWWRVATLWDRWGRGAGMAMLARRDLGDARLDWRGSGGCGMCDGVRKSEGLWLRGRASQPSRRAKRMMRT